MNKVALGLTLALAAMGCGRSQKPAAAAPDTALPSSSGDHDVAAAGDITDEAMSQLKTFRDKACACKDVACAEQAEKSFDDWGEANIDELKKATPSESFEKEFRKIQREARDCQEKLEEAARP